MDKTMTRHRSPLKQAAWLGAIAGMRSMSAPLVLSAYWQQSAHPPALPFPFALLTTPQVETLLKAAALGEMAFDKSPFAPDRTDAQPLLGRMTIGAGVGAAIYLAGDDSPVVGGIVGALAAMLSTFVMYFLRSYATEQLDVPPLAAGLAEDGLVVGSGWRFMNG